MLGFWVYRGLWLLITYAHPVVLALGKGPGVEDVKAGQ